MSKMEVKMRYKLIVEVNGEEQIYEHWDYCQAFTALCRLNYLGYKARIEEI